MTRRYAALGLLLALAFSTSAFAEDIGKLGHTEDQARTLVASVEGDLVAIDFTPSAAFEQTPGPNAGTPLRPPG